MTVSELYDLEPRQFQNKREGFNRVVEHDVQTRWEATRWMAAVVIAPHTKHKMKPRDLMTFPWENKKRVHRAASFDEVKEAVSKVFGNE